MTDELGLATACADRMYANDAASKGLGIEIEIPEPGSAVATMTVRDDMTNGFDMCHGGLIFTLADTAFAFACNAYNDVTVAASGTVEFIRPAFAGDQLRAVALEGDMALVTNRASPGTGGRAAVYVFDLGREGDRLELGR